MSLARSLLSLLPRTRHTTSLRCFSSEGKVQVSKDDKGIATVTLADPPVNSLTGNLLAEISDTMKKLNKDDSVKGITITSKFHGRVFSAGLNIYDMFHKGESHLGEFWRAVQEWYLDIYGCSKPVVAAINGHAPAGGCGMALMADYRVMMEGKTIGLNETQLGIVAPFFLTDLMISAVGSRKGELAILRGGMYPSDHALRIGMVDEVCDADNVMTLAHEQVSTLAKIPQPAYGLTKQLIRKDNIERLVRSREADVAHFVGFISQPGIQAHIGRYLENLKQRKK